MNICPVKLATVEPQTVVEPEENCRKYVMKDTPVPDTPKDEVSFGAKGYDKVISKMTKFKAKYSSDLWQCYGDLLYSLRRGIANQEIVATKDFSLFESGIGEYSTVDSGLKKIFAQNDSGEFIEKLKKEGSIVLAKKDCMPVLEMKYNDKARDLGRKLRLMPDNVYEIRFNSEGGAQSVIFGIDAHGDVTFKQLSDIAQPKYTSFYSEGNNPVKVVAEGEPWTGKFNGTYFHSGYHVCNGKNIIKTILLRLIQY